jgi:hypothetical protein
MSLGMVDSGLSLKEKLIQRVGFYPKGKKISNIIWNLAT